MLDRFMNKQSVAYSLLKNSLSAGKLSHAYLFDTNNYDDAFNFVLAFVQSIICNKHYTKFDACDGCNICNRIVNGNYPEVKIIESDSMVIKKEQLLELQSDFSKSSIEGEYRIYIIKDCDKMNKQASNCLLKFLEEPTPGIIAILMTNHFSRVLSTIISRCQIIRLTNVLSINGNSALENLAILSSNNKDEFLEDDTKRVLIDCILSFLEYYEENGLDILVYMKNMWHSKIQSREDFQLSFLMMIYFYYDILKFEFGIQNYFFCDKIELIEKIGNMNSIEAIIHKIDVLCYGHEMVRCNLNVNLLMDDIVIRLGEFNECS